VPGPRRARGRARSTIGGGLGIAAALIIALGATGGTYAYLNDSTTIASGGKVTAGTAALSVTGAPAAVTGLYPGATRYAAVTVTNTGNVALQLTADSLTRTSAANTFASSLTVGAGIAATAAACTGGTVTPSWTGTFASATAGSLGATVAPGASVIVCVSTAMASSAPSSAQSLTAAYTLTLGGRQP